MSKTVRESLFISLGALLAISLIALYANHWFDFSYKMFALGAVVSWVNCAGLAGAWVLYFDKKRVALAFSIIISKYAFLMLIILWILGGGTFLTGSGESIAHSPAELSAMALGFVGYLILLAFLLVLKRES